MLLRVPLILLAKTLRSLVRLAGGHGSALPGLVIEKCDHSFLPQILQQLPKGVIVVTGTNGKTTTARMIVHLLRSQGLRVLTNHSGSNLNRGIISTLIEHCRVTGKLDFDLAVFELDEAYAPRFAQKVTAQLFIALNVMRDQLDRYGELDTTAKLIATAAQQSKLILVNGSDSLLHEKVEAAASHAQIFTFGLASPLAKKLSSEANLFGGEKEHKKDEYDAAVVAIESTETAQKVTFLVGKKKVIATIPLLGVHNALNSCVALFATELITGEKAEVLATSFSELRPAFGRGETIRLGQKEVTVALIKNPSGFTQNLNTFVNPRIDQLLIVINDNYADGRDVSWLWDSNLSPLDDFKGKIYVGGVRRFDMAVCLKYHNIAYEVIDIDETKDLMEQTLARLAPYQHLLIIPTYTAMLEVRKWLARQKGGKRIW